jgi:hypothetical protein
MIQSPAAIEHHSQPVSSGKQLSQNRQIANVAHRADATSQNRESPCLTFMAAHQLL